MREVRRVETGGAGQVLLAGIPRAQNRPRRGGAAEVSPHYRPASAERLLRRFQDSLRDAFEAGTLIADGEECAFLSMDLADAYNCLAIQGGSSGLQDHQQYFGFDLRGRKYVMTALPFGWNQSPYCEFSCSQWQSVPSSESRHSTSCLFLRNRGDLRRQDPSGLPSENRAAARASTVAVLQALFSQWLSFFVSTPEALNVQPFGLANPSAEGWRPRRGDVMPLRPRSCRWGGTRARLSCVPWLLPPGRPAKSRQRPQARAQRREDLKVHE